LSTWLFRYWFWLSIAGIIAGYFSEYKKFTIYITLLSITYLLFISISQTKLEWYAAPLYPFLAFLVAILLYRAAQVMQAWHRLVPLVFLAAIFAYPYLQTGRKVYNPTEYEWDKDLYPISYVLQDAYRGNTSLDNYVICYQDYNTQLLFYIRALNDKGQRISFRDPQKLRAGDKVIASEPQVKEYIETNYTVELVREYLNVRIYKIIGMNA